jgi:hypothetical protein
MGGKLPKPKSDKVGLIPKRIFHISNTQCCHAADNGKASQNRRETVDYIPKFTPMKKLLSSQRALLTARLEAQYFVGVKTRT